MPSGPSDKRRTPRIKPFVVSCRILDGSRRLLGYLTELSTLGARVFCSEAPPAQDASVVLEVRFGRGPSRSRLAARVKWIGAGGSGDGYIFGLTFEGIGGEEQRTLQGVVEEFQRRAAELT